ncbi:SPW repeat domain-containing protein [Longitalea luteola]|uniref:SPW repeat domain-containing protein n=1 Tax=Longitalea luteola TaxID=2812563 RepID=UPI001A965B07|nr:SPW repeat protein [Longitalea luteola]
MNLLSTKIHGYIDYIMGALLIAAPWIFNFARDDASTFIPPILGIATILYSLLTRYELSQARMIPMRRHLLLDTIVSLLLIASPWLFGFKDYIWEPHVILGSIGLVIVFISKREPGEGRTPTQRHITGDNNIRGTAIH